MNRPQAYSTERYLLSKRSVDDRALNRGVLDALRSELPARESIEPRILELGAGVGGMVHRLLTWGMLERGTYTCVDADSESLRSGREHLKALFGDDARLDGANGTLHLKRAGSDLRVEFVEADIFEFLANSASSQYDLAVANAVLDLVDVPALLPRLWASLAPGRLFWFTINFDGETIFLPELALDADVMRLYHASMDNRRRNGRPAGDSKTGRHLLQHIPASGAVILEAGSSDWTVWPRNGRYPLDEAYFLHHIVHTIDLELASHPELDRAAFAAWIDTRHEQVRRAELIYVAHQLDVVGHTR